MLAAPACYFAVFAAGEKFMCRLLILLVSWEKEECHSFVVPSYGRQFRRYTPVGVVASDGNADTQFCRHHSTTDSIAEATSSKTAQGRALSFANSQVPSSAIK
jgi:hypothetical protein